MKRLTDHAWQQTWTEFCERCQVLCASFHSFFLYPPLFFCLSLCLFLSPSVCHRLFSVSFRLSIPHIRSLSPFFLSCLSYCSVWAVTFKKRPFNLSFFLTLGYRNVSSIMKDLTALLKSVFTSFHYCWKARFMYKKMRGMYKKHNIYIYIYACISFNGTIFYDAERRGAVLCCRMATSNYRRRPRDSDYCAQEELWTRHCHYVQSLRQLMLVLHLT